MTNKPVVFLSSDKYIINNPNPQNRQITDQIFAECLISWEDGEEFVEWSEAEKGDPELEHYIRTMFFMGAL